ncbi:MAG: ribonuclease HII [Clostridia bacterium]|nr:ribonuclease HII [Clostridia bacterium]MBR1675871.1 ribonuclease HII [Clostridia bacterium]
MLKKLEYERELMEKGYRYIAGVDEVGRGPLAGPVVCCAVIMPLNEEDIVDGVDDSKKVSEKKRKVLAEEIKKRAVSYKICRIEPEEIDEINILQATKKCMKECVMGLEMPPDVVLVDALDLDIPYKTRGIIKGDALSYSIGAASIVAKVYRDELMEKYAEVYPYYGFEKNKGYGTKAHIDALKERGACPIHRKTFIKNFSV